MNVLKGSNGQIDPKFGSVVQPLYASIRLKLEKADIDQEIKQCSIIAMAQFIAVCHKSLNESQIGDVIKIFNDRLQNDMTRDSTLKALVRITSNRGLNIPNIAMLSPRMFDLLHKAQRTIHLNALEALWSMVTNYSQQF